MREDWSILATQPKFHEDDLHPHASRLFHGETLNIEDLGCSGGKDLPCSYRLTISRPITIMAVHIILTPLRNSLRRGTSRLEALNDNEKR